jgi:tetratricopeptide (TPR) repeat protein
MLHNVLNKEKIEGKECLVICPSRERVKKLTEMVDSFYDTTSPQTGLLVMLDDDDPNLEEYKEMLGLKTAYHIGKKNTLTHLFNEGYKLFPDYRFYCLTNDDFVYKSAVWDIKLMSNIIENGGWGISYGDDLLAHEKYPSHPMISGNLVKALGWLQLPALKHLCGDWVLGTLGKGLGRIYYDRTVIIQHKHPLDKETKPDAIFEKTNSLQMYAIDQDAYKRWIKTQARTDITKVINAIFEEGKFDKKISLCMIIKQTEDVRNISQCLESVKDSVDELCIYINYVNIPNYIKYGIIKGKLKLYAKKYKKELHISYGKFNNFSYSRNITLKQATKDYIMYLDCDDIVPAPWTLKDIIFRFPEHDVFICHVVSHNEGKGDEHIMQSRILRRFEYLKFVNNVHEDISYSYKEGNPKAKVLRTDLIIEHMGNKSHKRVSRKNLRNYALTLKEINTDKAHSLTYFAIINELMLFGTKESAMEAIQWIDKFFDKFPDNGKDPLIPKMWILRGACALTCDQVEAARTNFAKAWHGWKHPEAAVMLGECNLRNQDYDKAINVLEEVKKQTEFEVCNVPIDMATIELVMLSKLGFAYYYKAQSIIALKKTATKMYNEDAHKIVGECLDKAAKNFEEFLSISSNDMQVGDTLSEIYRQLGRNNDANAVTVSMVNIFPTYSVGWKNLGIFEMMNSRFVTASVFLEKALRINPKDLETKHNLEMIKKRL